MGNWFSSFDANDLSRECESSIVADPLQLVHNLFAPLYVSGLLWIFVGIAYFSEDYFAVAIEGIIERYDIPPNIAGATLMAAGSSAPELISALVALFLTATAEAGSATVVGSAIFNQLVIVGGSILVAPGHEIRLEWRAVCRDMLFWALTIFLVAQALADERIVLYEAVGFVATYGFYVFVCARWRQIVVAIGGLAAVPDDKRAVRTARDVERSERVGETVGQIHHAIDMYALALEAKEPRARLREIRALIDQMYVGRMDELERIYDNDGAEAIAAHDGVAAEAATGRALLPTAAADDDDDDSEALFKGASSSSSSAPAAASSANGAAHGAGGLPRAPSDNRLVEVGVVDDDDGFATVRRRTRLPTGDDDDEPAAALDKPATRAVDPLGRDQRARSHSGAADRALAAATAAPSLPPLTPRKSYDDAEWEERCAKAFEELETSRSAAATRRLNEFAAIPRNVDIDTVLDDVGALTEIELLATDDAPPAAARGDVESRGGEAEVEVSDAAAAAPEPGGGGSCRARCARGGCLRALVKRALNVARAPFELAARPCLAKLEHEQKWISLFCASLVYLTVCVYLMMEWLEKSGCLLGITPEVMGLTFGAAGTSLPDCLVSLHVARRGEGTMAVSNVYGSNIFDILFALGLPWLIYLLIHPSGAIHFGRADVMVLLMGGSFIGFLVACVLGRWRQRAIPHGLVYLSTYALFVGYCFAVN